MTIKRRILLVVIISVVVIGSIAGGIILTNVLGGNQGATPDEATQPTTVAPTTAQPTTAAPTTVEPTTAAPEKEDEDADTYAGKGAGVYGIGGGTGDYIDPGDNSDMNGSKDSSSKDIDNEGRPIVYGGDEGYGADTSGKAAPVPEQVFGHPLPDPVNPETDFPDSKTITYEEIDRGLAILKKVMEA